MIEFALHYARLGWPVMPLHDVSKGSCSCRQASCKQPAKHPRTLNGVRDATTDEATITRWWSIWPNANIGIAVGECAGVIAIDFDQKDGGLETAALLADQFQDAKPVVQQSGGGGLHWFFKYPAGRAVGNRVRAMAGLDVRGNGGYVLVYPSRHASGKQYVWQDVDEVPTAEDLTDAPVGLIDLIANREHSTVIESVGGSVLVPSERRKIASALDNVQAVGAAWLQVGMALHDATDGSREGFDIWQAWSQEDPAYASANPHDHWQRWRSFKPRSNSVTLATLYGLAKTNGWIYVDDDEDGEIDLGDLSLQSQAPVSSKPLQHSPTPATAQTMVHDRVIVLGDQKIIRPREPRQLLDLDYLTSAQGRDDCRIDPYWRDFLFFRGCTFLVAGQPKIGKSRFVMDMMRAAATGGEWMGYPFTRPLRCLWLQAEIHQGAILSRVDPMLDELAEGDDEQNGAAVVASFRRNFLFSDRMHLDLLNDRDFAIAADMVDRARPDILCIDPLANFSSANENDNGEMSRFLRRVEMLRLAGNGCALVLVHHASKGSSFKLSSGAEPFDLIRGAGALRGAYDTGAVMVRDANQQIVVYWEARNCQEPKPHLLRFEGWRAEVESEEITINDKGVACGVAGLDDEFLALPTTSAPRNYTHVLAALHTLGQLAPIKARAYIDQGETAAKDRITELVRAGFIERDERGANDVVLRLSEAGRAWFKTPGGLQAMQYFNAKAARKAGAIHA